MKELIYTEDAPAPIGPYSQAVKAGNLLFISGQIPLTKDGALAGDDIHSQTRQCILNIISILKSQNADVNNVVKTTVLMKDLTDFPTMNTIYAEYFGESKPARAAYEVARLPKDVLIEIEAVAYLD